MPWPNVSRRVIPSIFLAAVVRAQCPNSIVAGPPSTYAGDGQPAISAWLFQPSALSLDSAGNLYIADSGNNRIRKVTTDGVMHTVAGPDGLNNPQFVLAAPDGSVYIADTGNNRIIQLTTTGAVKIIAGTGHPGYSGDNGAAIGAELNGPTGMALDPGANLYFADTYNSPVRRIDTKGIITTVPTGNPDCRPTIDFAALSISDQHKRQCREKAKIWLCQAERPSPYRAMFPPLLPLHFYSRCATLMSKY